MRKKHTNLFLFECGNYSFSIGTTSIIDRVAEMFYYLILFSGAALIGECG